jgi:hypothetical protein
MTGIEWICLAAVLIAVVVGAIRYYMGRICSECGHRWAMQKTGGERRHLLGMYVESQCIYCGKSKWKWTSYIPPI